jgi:predicted TIM-barrel fold metal-dependent hydrolase
VKEGDANAPFIERMAAYANVGHPVSETIAPAMDTSIFLTSIMAEGLLESFPKLKIVLAHSGASWLPIVLEKAETYMWLSHQKHPVSLEPGRVFFNRQTLVNFSTGEGAIRRTPEDFASVASWGSRYPNHDATDSVEAIADLEKGGVAGKVIEQLMGGNAIKMFGLAN